MAGERARGTPREWYHPPHTHPRPVHPWRPAPDGCSPRADAPRRGGHAPGPGPRGQPGAAGGPRVPELPVLRDAEAEGQHDGAAPQRLPLRLRERLELAQRHHRELRGRSARVRPSVAGGRPRHAHRDRGQRPGLQHVPVGRAAVQPDGRADVRRPRDEEPDLVRRRLPAQGPPHHHHPVAQFSTCFPRHFSTVSTPSSRTRSSATTSTTASRCS